MWSWFMVCNTWHVALQRLSISLLVSRMVWCVSLLESLHAIGITWTNALLEGSYATVPKNTPLLDWGYISQGYSHPVCVWDFFVKP